MVSPILFQEIPELFGHQWKLNASAPAMEVWSVKHAVAWNECYKRFNLRPLNLVMPDSGVGMGSCVKLPLRPWNKSPLIHMAHWHFLLCGRSNRCMPWNLLSPHRDEGRKWYNSMVGSGHTQGDALCRGTGWEEECPVAWQNKSRHGLISCILLNTVMQSS